MESSNTDSSKLVDSFIDSIWLEKGLSKNTLSSYRSDILSFSSWITVVNETLLLRTFKSIQGIINNARNSR